MHPGELLPNQLLQSTSEKTTLFGPTFAALCHGQASFLTDAMRVQSNAYSSLHS